MDKSAEALIKLLFSDLDINNQVDDPQVIQKALITKNVRVIQDLLDHPGPHPYNDKFLADQLLKNNWSLPRVVRLGRLGVTKLFIEGKGSIDVNSKNKEFQDYSALHEAAYNIDVDHAKLLLLDYNADPNILDCDLRTPLYSLYLSYMFDSPRDPDKIKANDVAALKIIKMLIDRGAKTIVAKDNGNVLQVRHILEFGSAEAIKTILDINIDVKELYDNTTVVHYLARNAQPKVWETMYDRDFDVNARNDFQQTPLWVSAKCINVDAVEFLLKKGADVNAKSTIEGPCTPVYIASENYTSLHSGLSALDKKRCMTCIMLLLQYDADVQEPSAAEYMPHTVFDLFLEYEDNSLYKITLEYLALQEKLDTPVSELIQSKIDSESKFKEYFNTCKQMLAAKVYQSDTLFKLLTCNEEKLVFYIRNEELVRILHSCSDNSVYYNQLLESRLAKASKLAKVRD